MIPLLKKMAKAESDKADKEGQMVLRFANMTKKQNSILAE